MPLTEQEFIQEINSKKASEWSELAKQKVLDYVTSTFTRFTPFDIQVVGSRVFGGWREWSDIDVWLYVEETLPDGTRYDMRPKSPQYEGGVQIDIKVATKLPDGARTRRVYSGHPEAPHEDGWLLPVYSLMTNELLDGHDNDLDSYVQSDFKKDLKQGIQPYEPTE